MTKEAELRGTLASRYAEVLGVGLTDALRQASLLSGVFLPDVFADYLNAPMRVMLIGKETKGWFKGIDYLHDPHCTDLDAYIQQAMAEYRRVDGIAPGKSKFGQFRLSLDRALSARAGRPVRHHWGNLFCIDYAKGSPVHSPHFEAILALSQRLLRVQLDLLRPDLLLFTTGVGSTRYDTFIKAMLHVTDSSAGTERHMKGQLWSFRADGIAAHRTAHPRYAQGEPGRRAALNQILGAMPDVNGTSSHLARQTRQF